MAPHMTNRLGEILVEKGFITPEQLYAAIKEQKKHRQRLASAHQVAHLKRQPALFTVACADEILRAHRENQHCASPHNFSIICREKINFAANDLHYDTD